ncbi:sensor histidine kinase [Cohnella sp.]|uniref:sensor histidine kinase n=1 Tax=Cohnella sp. TaxID=1883426 RepID=UPI003703A5C9
MNAIWNPQRLSIYPKIVFTFLIVVIPVFAVSLIINQSAAGNMREEIRGAMQSNVHFYLSSFQAEMNRIEALQREYLFDDDFQKISNMAHFMPVLDRTNAFLRIEKKLELLKNSNLYVNEASVDVPLIGKIIHSTRYDETPMPREKVDALSRKTRSPLIRWDDRLYLSSAYPESDDDEVAPVFLIAVELSERQINDSLDQIAGMEGSGAALLADDGSWIVDGGAKSGLDEALAAELPSFAYDSSGRGQAKIKLEGTSYLITYERSQALGAILLLYYPERQILNPLNVYKVLMWVLSAFSLAVIVGFSYWLYRIIHRPLRQLVRAFRRVEHGDLGVNVHYRKFDEFRYLYNQFNTMVNRLRVLIHEVYEQQIRNQRAELKQLQSQINPHFLYNSFYALYRMAKAEDLGNVVKMTQHLSKYYHFLTRTGMDEVSLEKEIDHAKSYVEIQMIRFQGQIEVIWQAVPEDCKTIAVPRMILQPLIENAFQYGLEERKDNGRLHIVFEREKDCLIIDIEDNGNNLTDRKLSELKSLMLTEDFTETTGIINVHKRLRLRFGESGGLCLARGDSGGLRVTLHIPYRKEG